MSDENDDRRRTSDINIAVLATEFKNLTTVVADIALRIEHLDNKVDRLSFVSPELYVADRQALLERIRAMESFKEWFLRLVVGAIVVGGIGLLFALK